MNNADNHQNQKMNAIGIKKNSYSYAANDSRSQKLGRIIRYHRTQKKMSQIRLADAANLNHSYYSNLENGKGNMTMRKFLDICEGLDTSPEDIIHDLCCYDENACYYDKCKKRRYG